MIYISNKGSIETDVVLGSIFLLTVAFILVLGFLARFIRLDFTRESQHTGYITAVQPEGVLFPNYKVYFKTDNSSSQEDNYCVNRNNRELADRLKRMSVERKLITITYEGVRGVGLGLCRLQEIRSISVR